MEAMIDNLGDVLPHNWYDILYEAYVQKPKRIAVATEE